VGADANQPRIATHRKTEETNAVAIESRRVDPTAKHEVDKPLYVGWPLDENGQIVDPATILPIIAGVINGGHDETSISENRCRRVVTTEPSGPAV